MGYKHIHKYLIFHKIITIVLDLLYNNFKTIIISIFKQDNKIIKKIKQILASTKIKFIKQISNRNYGRPSNNIKRQKQYQ